MKVKLAQQYASFNGTYKTTDLILYTNDAGDQIAYGKPSQPNPDTVAQRKVRGIGRSASQVWGTLPQAVRDEWETFTNRFACSPKRRRAPNVCREAQRMRMMIGLPPTTGAPRLCFPGPVTGVIVEPAADPREFRFRIEHAVDCPFGYIVLVKITEETPSTAWRPRKKDARSICGPGPESTVALPVNGELVSFASAIFAVNPGRRFGVAMTVIRSEDGLASPVAFFDLIRTAATTES